MKLFDDFHDAREYAERQRADSNKRFAIWRVEMDEGSYAVRVHDADPFGNGIPDDSERLFVTQKGNSRG